MILFTKTKAILLAGILLCTATSASAKDYDKRQVDCLIKNAYFEARGEPKRGQVAVIYTTLNRASSGKFPNDLCRVVYQPNQFSWTSNRNKAIKEKDVYEDVKDTVHEVLKGQHKDITQGALYFHTNSIKKPKDFGNVKCTARIGGHVFYKPSK